MRHPRLAGDRSFDAIVLGAGITGLCTAYALRSEGLSVAVVEQRWIGAGATGHTTAKLSSLQGTRYSKIRSRLGLGVARDYAEANEAGIAEIQRLSAELAIECDLREQPNYVYAANEKERGSLEDEADAAAEAGLGVEWVDRLPLPFETHGGLRLDGQAEFHPVKFMDGIARALLDDGAAIYEQTRALGVRGSDPHRVETDGGELTAPVVVIATQFPFLDRALLFARMHPERSYSIAARIKGPPPPGMFISAGSPIRSIRAHPQDGGELLLVGGESHKPGQGGPTGPRYETLSAFAEHHFGAGAAEFRWSTQDNITIDGAPYIGRPLPRHEGLFVATGYAKWGLALAPIAARIIAQLAVGHDHPQAASFDPKRLPPVRALPEMAREGADFSLRFARRVVSSSPSCPHMGCPLSWNDAERSWDCPCHGSRFDAEGHMLQGPAVDDLELDPSESAPEAPAKR